MFSVGPEGLGRDVQHQIFYDGSRGCATTGPHDCPVDKACPKPTACPTRHVRSISFFFSVGPEGLGYVGLHIEWVSVSEGLRQDISELCFVEGPVSFGR